ncbi:hypothetical protein BDV93DRAFT_199898 [Ceratobasidium sp. AG-I]|nr:hypothetical protein BDV93DRAFT_199898 [Ceratobasidium sp. AG-I]
MWTSVRLVGGGASVKREYDSRVGVGIDVNSENNLSMAHHGEGGWDTKTRARAGMRRVHQQTVHNLVTGYNCPSKSKMSYNRL